MHICTAKILQIDIEGNELTVLPQLISSGILKNVLQIGIEFHWIGTKNNFKDYFDIMAGLHNQGFKTIYWENNFLGKIINGFCSTFEIVFRKTELDC